MAPQRICSVDGCGKTTVGRGWCREHYYRNQRHGSPTGGRMSPVSTRKGDCEIDGCGRPRFNRGLCQRHYGRFLSHGDPRAGRVSPGTLTAWILNHAEHDGDECLPWPFAPGGDGHGRLKFGDRGRMVASRAMCIAAHGEPPTPKHQAAHSCGNGHNGCCNQKHLRWATGAENSADSLVHGTRARGEKHGASKLSAEVVREIRALAGTMPMPRIAERFDISREHARDIARGKRWAHVSPEGRTD